MLNISIIYALNIALDYLLLFYYESMIKVIAQKLTHWEGKDPFAFYSKAVTAGPRLH